MWRCLVATAALAAASDDLPSNMVTLRNVCVQETTITLHASTGHIAMMYFDRALSTCTIEHWKWQRLAVVCLILAAKSEEREEEEKGRRTVKVVGLKRDAKVRERC